MSMFGHSAGLTLAAIRSAQLAEQLIEAGPITHSKPYVG